MIDWLALLTVLGVSIAGALASVGLVAVGIRLLATPPTGGAPGGGAARDAEDDEATAAGRPVAATIGAYACFAGFALVVLFGIYLIVPYFH